jgi:hypothetical protein
MKRKQQLEAQSFVRARAWAQGRSADFTHNPPQAVDSKFNGALSKLGGVISSLGGTAAIQAGGDFGEETGAQAVLRSEVLEALRNVNRTMSAVAEDQEIPEIMDRFRMPHGDNDSALPSKLRAFATAIDELSMGDELAGHANAESAASLRAMATAFEGSEGEQGGALADRAGATAQIPVHLRSGKAAVKTLNAIFSNKYKGNTELLTAWKTASHVQKSGGGGDNPDSGQTPTPPTPPPA